MNTDQNSRELELHERSPEVEVEAEEIPREVSEQTHRLILFTLFLSAASSALAIFVAKKGWHETGAARKNKAQAAKNMKRELQGLHKEIKLLKEQLEELQVG